MTEEARAARNAYKRRWAAENPERVKAYQSRYWQRKAESDRRESQEITDSDGGKDGDGEC